MSLLPLSPTVGVAALSVEHKAFIFSLSRHFQSGGRGRSDHWGWLVHKSEAQAS